MIDDPYIEHLIILHTTDGKITLADNPDVGAPLTTVSFLEPHAGAKAHHWNFTEKELAAFIQALQKRLDVVKEGA